MRRFTTDDRRRRQRHDELLPEPPPAHPIERKRLPPRPSLIFCCEFCPRRFADLDALEAHRRGGCGPSLDDPE